MYVIFVNRSLNSLKNQSRLLLPFIGYLEISLFFNSLIVFLIDYIDFIS